MSLADVRQEGHVPRLVSFRMPLTLIKARLGRAFALALMWIAFVWTSRSEAAVEREPVDFGGVVFDNLTIEDGLSQNGVTCSLQDHQGFMWFGTQDGLNRYDGVEFRVYRAGEPGDDGLPSSSIQTLFEDASHNIWVGTRGGLSKFDPTTERFETFKHSVTEPDSLSDNSVNAISSDGEDRLWVGTSRGLNRYEPGAGGFVRFVHKPDVPGSLIDDHVTALVRNDAGGLWIGTAEAGIALLDFKLGTFQKQTNLSAQNVESENAVRTIFQARHGILWIGTNSSLWRFDPDTGESKSYRHTSFEKGGFPEGSVDAVYVDSSGALWFGTAGGMHGGLARVENPEAPIFDVHLFKSDPNDPHSLGGVVIASISEDRSGVLWVGTRLGGIGRADLARKEFGLIRNRAGDSSSLNHNVVYTIFRDSSGGLWVSTTAGLNRFDAETGMFGHDFHDPNNPRSLPTNYFGVLHEVEGEGGEYMWMATRGALCHLELTTMNADCLEHDPKNDATAPLEDIWFAHSNDNKTLWIGGDGNGLAGLDLETKEIRRIAPRVDATDTKRFNQMIMQTEDPTGRMWVVTRGGIELFDPVDERFISYQQGFPPEHPLRLGVIMTAHADARGDLWVGTNGKGLYRYNPASGLTQAYGRSNDLVYAIHHDREGNIWYSTNRGLTRLNPETGRLRHYDVSDGLQSNEFNQTASFKDENGVLYFGGVNGLTLFDPANIRDSPFVPSVVLTQLKISNETVRVGVERNGETPLSKAIGLTDSIRLSYLDNSLSFEFAALQYSAPEANEYAYMMEGIDKDWNYVGDRNFAIYTSIPPGDYRLRVKAANGDGVWNDEGVSLRVEIVPPFWQTWWFRVVVGLSTAVLGYAIVQARIRSVHAQNRLLEEQVFKRTAELKASLGELEERNRDMRMVLDNVEQGLITVLRDGTLAMERSRVVDRWLGSYCEGTTFVEYARRADPRFAIAAEMSWDMLDQGILPVDFCIEQFPRRMQTRGRTLEFSYLPIMNGNRLHGILTVIADITQELEFAKKEASQREVLTVFHHVMRDRPWYLQFYQQAAIEIGSLSELDPVGSEIKRKVHTLKGNSGLFGLDTLASLCHSIESAIADLDRGRVAVLIDDLQKRWSELDESTTAFVIADKAEAIQMTVDEFNTYLECFRDSCSGTVEFARFEELSLEPVRAQFERLGQQAKSLGRRLGKGDIRIEIPHTGLRLESSRWGGLWGELAHILRNSIDHGFENNALRAANDPVASPQITFAAYREASRLVIEIADNGKGIDWHELGLVAKQNGLSDTSREALIEALFSEGVTTKRAVTDISGRGVGMSAVRAKVRELGGEICVWSQPGQGTKWTMIFANAFDIAKPVRQAS